MDTIKSCDLRVSLQTGLKESSPNSYGMAKMTTLPMFFFFFFFRKAFTGGKLLQPSSWQFKQLIMCSFSHVT